jgi:Xaa-Pro aminopeptidase
MGVIRVTSSIEAALLAAQAKAESLFADIVSGGLIRPGVLESELSGEIHALARKNYGVGRHWHKRVVRAGPNTMLSYYDEPPDRRVEADDSVYLDLGPVFDSWEADYGRTYVVGNDPVKHKLVADIETAFARGRTHFERTPGLTCGGLYDYVANLATESGWQFGAASAGHLIGHFPHETAPADSKRLSIRSGNDLDLRAPDANGAPRHWILEIHFIDKARGFGGFFEQLLTP